MEEKSLINTKESKKGKIKSKTMGQILNKNEILDSIQI